MAKMYRSKTFLYQRYVVERKSLEQIAREAKCEPMTVYNWLKKFDLLRRSE